MSTKREGVNPLRPYYVPPTIGASVGSAPSQPNPNPFSQGSANGTAAGTKYASKARDIFPDLDYKDYINDSGPSGAQAIKSLIDELLWKYTSVLMAQPFEVAKTILQVRMQDDMERIANGATPVSTPRQSSFTEERYDQVRSLRHFQQMQSA
jgi:mitochondrial fusion and transport protein UGO1